MTQPLPLLPLIAAACLAGSLVACTPSEGVARYCLDQGHAAGSAAYEDCVQARQSYRRLQYLGHGGGAGAGG